MHDHSVSFKGGYKKGDGDTTTEPSKERKEKYKVLHINLFGKSFWWVYYYIDNVLRPNPQQLIRTPFTKLRKLLIASPKFNMFNQQFDHLM